MTYKLKAFQRSEKGRTMIANARYRDILLGRRFRELRQTINAFCPTGPGGGVDPTCSPSKTKHAGPVSVSGITPNGNFVVAVFDEGHDSDFHETASDFAGYGRLTPPPGLTERNMVGVFSVTRQSNGSYNAGVIEVHRDFHRRGIATRLYDLAEKVVGQRINPSDLQTVDMREFWKARSQTTNARRKPANPLRLDPSRTGRIRQRFSAEMTKRFDDLRKRLWKLVVEEDALGLGQTATANSGNCGTGAGGFQPGNTCARGGGSLSDLIGQAASLMRDADDKKTLGAYRSAGEAYQRLSKAYEAAGDKSQSAWADKKARKLLDLVGDTADSTTSGDSPLVSEDRRINDELKPDYRIPKRLYHVCRGKDVEKIKSEGLRWSKKKNLEGTSGLGVYLSDDPNNIAAGQIFETDDPYVIEVRTKGLEFRLDPEYYVDVMSRDDFKRARKENGLVVYTRQDIDRSAVLSVRKLVRNDGAFDEHKAMIGYRSEAEARAAYLRNYQKGWRGLGGITGLTMAQLKAWLETGDTSRPIKGQQIALNAFCPTGKGGGRDNSCLPRPTVNRLLQILNGDCGTGAGGFKPGNTCGKGGGGDPYKTAGVRVVEKFSDLKNVGSRFTQRPTTGRIGLIMPDGTLLDTEGADHEKFMAGQPSLFPPSVRDLVQSQVDRGVIRVTQEGDTLSLQLSEKKYSPLAIAEMVSYGKLPRARFYFIDLSDGFVELTLDHLLEARSWKHAAGLTANTDCGTGAGGFKPGNTCGKSVDSGLIPRVDTLKDDGPDFPIGTRRVGQDGLIDEMQEIAIRLLKMPKGNRLYLDAVRRYTDRPTNRRPTVVLKDGKYLVDDGNHRIAADKARGLKRSKVWVRVEGMTTNAGRWAFLTSSKRLEEFVRWFKVQLMGTVLESVHPDLLPTDAEPGESWLKKYVRETYRKSLETAHDLMKPTGVTMLPTEAGRAYQAGGKAQFLRQAFNGPAGIERLRQLAGRAYDDLDGISTDLSNKISRELLDGMVKGESPRAVGRRLNKMVDGYKNRGLAIARTETLRAHNEGQLDGLEALGATHVGAQVEWSTSGLGMTALGNPSPCPLCAELQGVVLTIQEARGLLPRHVNCMCAWRPANVGESTKGQIRRQDQIKVALERSLRLGKPKKAKLKDYAKTATWPGGRAKISKTRPKTFSVKK